MAGLIGGALGGAGQAAVRFGENMQRGAIDAELEKLRNENATNRAIALEKARISLGNQQREAGVARVNKAQAGLITEAKVGRLNQLYGEGSNLTAADVSEEEMASPDAQLSQGEQDKLRTKAAISTGDIAPKDAALLGAKDDATEARTNLAMLRMEAINARTQSQYEVAMAKVEATVAKAAGGKKDAGNKEMLSLLDGMRKDVASEAANLKGMYAAEIKDRPRSKVAEVEAAYKPKFDALAKRRAQIQKDFNAMRARVGLPPAENDAEETPAPAAAPAPANRPPLSSFQK